MCVCFFASSPPPPAVTADRRAGPAGSRGAGGAVHTTATPTPSGGGGERRRPVPPSIGTRTAAILPFAPRFLVNFRGGRIRPFPLYVSPTPPPPGPRFFSPSPFPALSARRCFRLGSSRGPRLIPGFSSPATLFTASPDTCN